MGVFMLRHLSDLKNMRSSTVNGSIDRMIWSGQDDLYYEMISYNYFTYKISIESTVW